MDEPKLGATRIGERCECGETQEHYDAHRRVWQCSTCGSYAREHTESAARAVDDFDRRAREAIQRARWNGAALPEEIAVAVGTIAAALRAEYERGRAEQREVTARQLEARAEECVVAASGCEGSGLLMSSQRWLGACDVLREEAAALRATAPSPREEPKRTYTREELIAEIKRSRGGER